MMEVDQMNLSQLCYITSTYGTVLPEHAAFFNDIAPHLHEQLQLGYQQSAFSLAQHIQDPNTVRDRVPDLTTYTNLWLAITCFAVKQMSPTAQMPGSVRLIAKDLIKLFQKNPRWKATDKGYTIKLK